MPHKIIDLSANSTKPDFQKSRNNFSKQEWENKGVWHTTKILVRLNLNSAINLLCITLHAIFFTAQTEHNCEFISQNCEFISQNCEFISQNCEFISQNSEFISQNCEFISQNCEFISQNCEFISQNCEKKSQNCEIKSHNYLVLFFIQWRKRASIVKHNILQIIY